MTSDQVKRALRAVLDVTDAPSLFDRAMRYNTALSVIDRIGEDEAGEARLAEYRNDAERYRWLRETLHKAVGSGVEVNDRRLVYEEVEPGEAVRIYWYPDTPVGFYESKADTLDDAIDAAMGEKGDK